MGVLKVYSFDEAAVQNTGEQRCSQQPATAAVRSVSALHPLPKRTCGCRWVCTGMLDKVRELLTSDPDPMVVSNCMSVIVKVRLSSAPRIDLVKKWVHGIDMMTEPAKNICCGCP
jgi:hypothetical protein